MFALLKQALNALQAGEQLSNSAGWKVKQNIVNSVGVILGFVALLLPYVGVNIEISNEDIIAIAGGIAAVGSMFNGYFTTATTDKIGMQNTSNDKPDGSGTVAKPSKYETIEYTGG